MQTQQVVYYLSPDNLKSLMPNLLYDSGISEGASAPKRKTLAAGAISGVHPRWQAKDKIIGDWWDGKHTQTFQYPLIEQYTL